MFETFVSERSPSRNAMLNDVKTVLSPAADDLVGKSENLIFLSLRLCSLSFILKTFTRYIYKVNLSDGTSIIFDRNGVGNTISRNAVLLLRIKIQ